MRLAFVLPIAALALSGCVVQNPGGMPPPVVTPPVMVPNPDAAVRSSARVVINREWRGACPAPMSHPIPIA